MKDIKCGLKSCKYNCGYGCVAKSISVNKKADCTTFLPDKAKQQATFEAGTDYVQAGYNVNTEVGCVADCVFNKSGKCAAVGITVMSEDKSTAGCLTFLKK